MNWIRSLMHNWLASYTYIDFYSTTIMWLSLTFILVECVVLALLTLLQVPFIKGVQKKNGWERSSFNSFQRVVYSKTETFGGIVYVFLLLKPKFDMKNNLSLVFLLISNLTNGLRDLFASVVLDPKNWCKRSLLVRLLMSRKTRL